VNVIQSVHFRERKQAETLTQSLVHITFTHAQGAIINSLTLDPALSAQSHEGSDMDSSWISYVLRGGAKVSKCRAWLVFRIHVLRVDRYATLQPQTHRAAALSEINVRA